MAAAVEISKRSSSVVVSEIHDAAPSSIDIPTPQKIAGSPPADGTVKDAVAADDAQTQTSSDQTTHDQNKVCGVSWPLSSSPVYAILMHVEFYHVGSVCVWFILDFRFQKLRNGGSEQTSNTMGGNGAADYVGISEGPSPRAVNHGRKVSVLPLVFLIFYEVSGGPFGIEDSVNAAGPLLALAGFLIFPLIWSVPEALITAEMGTMFPENGGYVVWVSSAIGPFWGFQQGWMKWLSGVIDNALYPVLFLDYLKSGIPALGGGLPRVMALLALTIVLTYMNYRGLTIVGWVAVLLGVFSILPFVVMGFISIPKLRPKRWLVADIHNVDWNLYLNTLFWNLNYWDSISTLAGEVENPRKTLPKALFYALIHVVLGYLFPLLTGTGAIPLHRDLWTDGYFSDVAMIIGGVWLRWWIQGLQHCQIWACSWQK
ncbi:UNVERIFIED_CONTAM: putative polyamine transporter [Sesamum radiatum]|uniref:Polyamine transporter n=1 Tax=Sesamum radiatum TaxID=300843 RepID=A0AAW2MGT2_SESRA